MNVDDYNISNSKSCGQKTIEVPFAYLKSNRPGLAPQLQVHEFKINSEITRTYIGCFCEGDMPE